MRFIIFFIFSSLFIGLANAQTTIYRDTIPVFEAGNRLLSPWAGGLNFSSFTQIDLNNDGKKDIVAYDRIGGSGGKLRAFLNIGTPGLAKYKHAFNYQDQFPPVSEWALFFDYNNDGKADIFTYTVGGVKVFKNTTTGQNLTFVLASSLLKSDYNPFGLPNVSNIPVSAVAIPGIADIDNDGDLDILTYSVFGTIIQFHKNMSQELYNHSDSLVYDMVDDCWGDIKENNCVVDLFQCPYMKMYQDATDNDVNKPMHSGSCIMCFDRDGDGDKDLILGDISCSNVFYVDNQGSSTNAHIMDTTILYPNFPNKASTNVIRLNSFPCTYNLDVDNDGFKDLIASPNAISGAENYQSVWYYKNASTTPTVNFVLQKKNFLQEDMLEFGEGSYPVLFDADADGKKDLIIGNLGYYTVNTNKSKLAYYRNIGTATAPSFSLITRDYQSLSTYNIYSMAPTFGDLDNDGDADLIIGDLNGTLHYFENTAGAGNAAVFNNHISNYKTIDVGSSAFPQLFDIDKNGTLDLIIGSQNGKLNFHKNIGTTSVPNFSFQTAALGGVDVRNLNIGSLTGFSMPYMYLDAGVTKLIVGCEMGNIYMYNNIDGNLTGTFNKVDTNLYHINEGPRSAPCFEDVTSDGLRDLFVGNYAGGVGFFNSQNASAVGVKELLNDDYITVFPNPANDFITVKVNDDSFSEMSIKLFDVVGKEVMVVDTYNKTIQMDISFLSKGIYIIQLKGKDEKQTTLISRKLIIQ